MEQPLQLQGVTNATIIANQTSLSTKIYIVKGLLAVYYI